MFVKNSDSLLCWISTGIKLIFFHLFRFVWKSFYEIAQKIYRQNNSEKAPNLSQFISNEKSKHSFICFSSYLVVVYLLYGLIILCKNCWKETIFCFFFVRIPKQGYRIENIQLLLIFMYFFSNLTIYIFTHAMLIIKIVVYIIISKASNLRKCFSYASLFNVY